MVRHFFLLSVIFLLEQFLPGDGSYIVPLINGDSIGKMRKQTVFVLFYEQYENPGKALLSTIATQEFEKASRDPCFDDFPDLLALAAMRCERQHQRRCKSMGVTAFPTIWIYADDKDKPTTFSEALTSESIVEQLLKEKAKMNQNQVASVEQDANGDKGKFVKITAEKRAAVMNGESERPLLVLVYDAVMNSSLEMWKEVVKLLWGKYDVGMVDMKTNAEDGFNFPVGDSPTIMRYPGSKEDGDRKLGLKYTGNQDVTSIVKWAKDELYGYVTELTMDNFEVKVLLHKEPWLILLQKDQDSVKFQVSILKDFALQLDGRILVGTIKPFDLEEITGRFPAAHFPATEDEHPTFCYVTAREELKSELWTRRYVDDNNCEPEMVVDWANDCYFGGMSRITDDNFHREVLNPDEPWMLFNLNDRSGTFEGVDWQKVLGQVKNLGIKLGVADVRVNKRIAKISWEANANANSSVVFYEKGSKFMPEFYPQPATAPISQDLVKWMRQRLLRSIVKSATTVVRTNQKKMGVMWKNGNAAESFDFIDLDDADLLDPEKTAMPWLVIFHGPPDDFADTTPMADMKNTWNQVATSIELKGKLNVGAVDVTENPLMANTIFTGSSIKFFSTLVPKPGQVRGNYKGKWNKRKIVKFALSKLKKLV